ncbi:MAG: sulfoxide reductase heme-binding subunit YedZ [Saprospiraceae bacterium]|jgi:sulfoxide reductase heme-binding subunit YedZ
MKKIFLNKYWLWLILAIPLIGMIIGLSNGQANYDNLMHATGEFAGRFLIMSLVATPIVLMFPTAKASRWLVRNRRYFGIAAFGYTLLHTVFYVYEKAFSQVMSEFTQIGLLSAWIAFFIFVPMAITSNDYFVRKMGASWKKLQRWVYLAALMTFVHWVFIHMNWKPAVVHFLPVLLLQFYRLYKTKVVSQLPKFR